MTPTASAATGANIRAEMARRGLTQEQLASAIGLSQPRISKRLRGEVPFDINELSAIAAVLGVPIDRLLEGVAA